jgi:hypothetical protein
MFEMLCVMAGAVSGLRGEGANPHPRILTTLKAVEDGYDCLNAKVLTMDRRSHGEAVALGRGKVVRLTQPGEGKLPGARVIDAGGTGTWLCRTICIWFWGGPSWCSCSWAALKGLMP